MFCYADGIRLLDVDLALDARQRQRAGFVSHAHADHYAPHEGIWCTPATARLIETRWGRLPRHLLPFGEAVAWGDCRLTAYPAGHVLGSAMLRVDNPAGRLLYTGDFQLRPSLTSEPAEPPRADVLVMECTFGAANFRFPPREQLVAQLLECVHKSLAVNRTPVLFAYALGKAQEITRVLADHQVPVMVHPQIAALHRTYEALGCRVGPYELDAPERRAGHALIMPPRGTPGGTCRLPERRSEIVLSGRCLDSAYRWRMGGDYHLPWSDHADYDELLDCVERVDPAVVYCWHGQPEFVETLRRRRRPAHWIERTTRVPRPLPARRT